MSLAAVVSVALPAKDDVLASHKERLGCLVRFVCEAVIEIHVQSREHETSRSSHLIHSQVTPEGYRVGSCIFWKTRRKRTTTLATPLLVDVSRS